MTSDLRPYPDYKKSGLHWLGQVPKHWDLLPAFACYSPRTVKNTGMVETTVLSLSHGRIVVKPPEKLHGLVPESFESYQIADPGDIIIRTTDLQNDKNSLRVGQVRDRGIITSAYLCLHTQELLTSDFGYHYLNAWDLTKGIYGYGSGLRQNLDFAHFKRMPVAVPPRDEQDAIVGYLDEVNQEVDRFIQNRQRLIDVLNEQKQAIINRAVTRGGLDRHEFEPTDNMWFPELPSSWQVVPLRRVITRTIDGPHHSPSYVDEGIPFISARNIRVDEWQLESAKYISQEDYDEFCRRVRPEIGDVLYTKGGTTGIARAVDLDFPFQVWVHVAVLKIREQVIDPFYLASVLNSSRCYEQAQLFTRGATNQDLGLGRMKNIFITLPPSLTEQRSLVESISRQSIGVLKAIKQAEREIDLIREYRTRLVADVVTGKLTVPRQRALMFT